MALFTLYPKYVFLESRYNQCRKELLYRVKKGTAESKMIKDIALTLNKAFLIKII